MRMRRIAVLGAVVALALAGCQGDEPQTGEPQTGEPQTGEPQTGDVPAAATAQPEPEPEPAGAPVPELEEVPGEAPEVTFVKHFYDVYWYARETGEVEPYLELTHPDCQMCRESVSRFQEVYGDGGRIEGGSGEFLTEPHAYEDADPLTVVAVYTEPANEVFDADDELVDEVPPCERITETLELQEEDDAWVVRDMEHSLECDG